MMVSSVNLRSDSTIQLFLVLIQTPARRRKRMQARRERRNTRRMEPGEEEQARLSGVISRRGFMVSSHITELGRWREMLGRCCSCHNQVRLQLHVREREERWRERRDEGTYL